MARASSSLSSKCQVDPHPTASVLSLQARGCCCIAALSSMPYAFSASNTTVGCHLAMLHGDFERHISRPGAPNEKVMLSLRLLTQPLLIWQQRRGLPQVIAFYA